MHQRNRTWMIGSDPIERVRQRTMAIEGGDGSTLNLDFSTGVLDPRLTFKRASTATFVNSQGYVQYAGANLLLQSERLDITSAWTKLGGTTCTSESVINPIGGALCSLVTSSGSGTSAIIQYIRPTLGLPAVYRIWVRAGTSSKITIAHFNSTSFNACIPSIVSGPGTVTGITTASVQGLTSDWTLVELKISSITADGAGSALYIYPDGTAGVAGASNYVWGAQLNPGSTAQTYYPTTTPAYHAPRFDYNPTNIGEPKGLLIEGQTQNALFYSQDVTQASRWTIQAFGSGSYTTVSTTGGTAPDNTNTANLLTEGTASFSRSIYQSVSMAIGTHTASLFVKAGSGNARYIRLVLASAAGNFVYVTVNLANGAVTQTAAAVGTATAASAIVTPYTGGWYRISLTGTFTAATNFCFIVPSDSATPAVNTGDYGRYDYVGTGASFSLWGCQVEAGSGASSYIPTGASQVTRALDHCYATGENFTSWFSVGAGTMVVVSDIIKSNIQNLNATISDDSTSNYVRMGFKVGGAANEYLLTTVGGAASFQGAADSGYAPPLNTVYKMGYAWDTNNFAIVANGGSVGTDISGTLASAGVLTKMVIGGDFVSIPNDIYFKNGHIRSLKYFPTRLSNAQLQTLTAP